jgi:predicted enzyme related to lactoylglutathione lyase
MTVVTDWSKSGSTTREGTMPGSTVSVRYIVDDVGKAIAFYTTHLGFTLEQDARPAFASVERGSLRLLLSGPGSSGAKTLPDGRRPVAGGWNRILLIVDDITAEVGRLRASGLTFRNDILKGVGGSQILLDDPFGNPIELFEPAGKK